MGLSDRQLLDRYLAGNDETAFRLLVERYLTLVHGVARRVTRSDDLARDISQAAFLRLASRAALIPSTLSLAAWLHRTTHSMAATLVRTEERRKKRERLAAADMNAHDDPSQAKAHAWDALAPVIDRLVDALPAADRELLLARFYRGEAHATIAARLGMNEALARKRTSRALEKLRAMLGKQGIATTSAALATLLPANAASTAVPATLTGSILTAAQGITPLIPSTLHAALLVMNATQKSLIIAAAAVFLASLGYAVRPADAASSIATSSRNTSSNNSASTSPRPLTARAETPIPTTAEGRRERLRQIIAIPNPLTRRREMLAFTAKLQTEHFPDLYAAFNDYYGYRSTGNPFYPESEDARPEHIILATAWARKDPADALDAIKSQRIPQGTNSVLAFALGATHPQDAVKWAKDAPSEWKGLLLCGVGSVDLPAAVAGITDGKPEAERGNSIYWLSRFMDDEPDLLSRLAALAQPGQERSDVLEAYARNETDINAVTPAVWEAIKTDPQALRNTDARQFFRNLCFNDPDLASSAIQDLPPGKIRNQAIMGVTFVLALSHDANAGFALLDRYPEVANDASYESYLGELLHSFSQNNPGESLLQIQRYKDPTTREVAQLSHLQQWKAKDPAAMQAWLDANPTAIPQTVQSKLHSEPPPAQPGPSEPEPVDFRPLETP